MSTFIKVISIFKPTKVMSCFFRFFRSSSKEEASTGSSPLHWVFLKKAREERAGLGAQCAGEADVFHED